MISLQYEPANGKLAGLVSSFYRFDFEGDSFCELERADRAQFRFQLRGEGNYCFPAGHVLPTYPVTILGPTTAPVTTKGQESLTVVGWGMEAAGWAALMGSDGEKFIDNALDARQIFGDVIETMRQQLLQCTKVSEQFSIMRQIAEDIFANRDHAASEFTTLVDLWLIEDRDHEIENLVKSSGLSQRQLERMTKRYYGLPPRKLARKYRALRAAQMLTHGEDLDDSELGLAFYDQSHLVREVKQFTGLTPSQLRAGEAELTQKTMKARKAMDGKVSKLISDS